LLDVGLLKAAVVGVVAEALRRLACVSTPGASGLASRSVDFDG
jgi:hypothetical protein